jgi:hypothetical protein
MRREALRQRANLAIAGAATLFLADLFLNWHRVAMHMGGVVDVRTTASGWSGWGAIAGICALALLVLVLAAPKTPAIGVLALGPLLFTLVEVLAGNARVDAATSMMRVQVDTTLWPAWVGLALAGTMAAAAAVSYLAATGEREPTAPVPHGLA